MNDRQSVVRFRRSFRHAAILLAFGLLLFMSFLHDYPDWVVGLGNVFVILSVGLIAFALGRLARDQRREFREF